MIDKLASCDGTWQGTSQLQLDPEAGMLAGEGREDLAVDATYTRV